MLRDLVTKSPILLLPLGTLVVFLAIFITALVWTYGRKAAAFDPLAKLPLEENDHE